MNAKDRFPAAMDAHMLRECNIRLANLEGDQRAACMKLQAQLGITRGELSCSELVGKVLERIAELEAQLDAAHSDNGIDRRDW